MTAPVALHLLRHGAPARVGMLLGRTDMPVTAEGIVRCREASHGLDVAAVIASDLSRASACGEAVAAQQVLPLHIDPRWRELDFGAWDGLPPEAVNPSALARFHADPDACPPPRGERWSALTGRIGAALAEIDRPTLVVTHGGAMRAALAAACGFDARQVWSFALPYACLLSLTLWPGSPPAAQVVGLRP